MSSDPAHATRTLVDLLRCRAQLQADRLAYRFWVDGDRDERGLTYGELDRQARAVAAWLQHENAAGERVLLLYPPGLDFIVGFFGCLYAGAVAVPAYAPPSKRLVPRLARIASDARARFALTADEALVKASRALDEAADSLRWCATDTVDYEAAAAWADPGVDPNTLAVIQYTSGSTSSPRGVMLAHRNFVHNLETIRQAWDGGPDAVGVFWLPLHHDMGLVGGVLEPMWVSGRSLLLAPTAFVERPLRWLECMSRYRGTISAAPNFAYDLCVDKTTAAEREGLDLSAWRTAMCGAETVRAGTLERFVETFEPYGFRRESLHPVYGLAEATLLVSGGPGARAPVVRRVSARALTEHDVVDVPPAGEDCRALVGCGSAQNGQRIAIVDPETLRVCPADRIGEIWVSGGSVALGYWGEQPDGAGAFEAFIPETGDGPFLRTGDLGFLRDGELFVTGRLKSLILIRGRNYYPDDIEATVQETSLAFVRARGAAFSIDGDERSGEELVVVQEVDRASIRDLDADAVIARVRTAITREHDIQVRSVVLVPPWSLPTTSSGKIERHLARELFEGGELKAVAAWHAPEPQVAPEPRETRPAADGGRTAAEIESWLVAQLAKELGLSSSDVDVSQPFALYGLDSVRAVALSAALQAWLGRELSPTLAYEYPTVELLARHLADLDAVDGDTSVAAGPGAAADDGRVAIVGIGCRFPGADGPEAFWRLLRDAVDAVVTVPSDRWDVESFYDVDPAAPGKMNTSWGGFLDAVDQFDPEFFGISPREAARMDPQQRLLLEVAWEALEDAGQPADRLSGSRTGVFVGISSNDYGQPQMTEPALADAYAGTGNALSIAANRLSYQFDFRGPSIAVDTACSSSLVAVHLACRSLLDGSCTLAVAGGVNVILSPAITINFAKAGFMAPDGRCKAFDARADGYVRGEGAGVVVLKRLADAVADGDPIHAVILGSAVNNDGRTNGLTAPSRQAQEEVLRDAYRQARVSPARVQYVEAHGTGTALGDPIEVSALANVFGDGRADATPLAIGSVKTNFGHLEAAAGIAGLVKVALSLAHRELPPSLHFEEPNPYIPFDSLPVRVQESAAPWDTAGGPALAGVSSFGFGGTNAHVVLAEAPPPGPPPEAGTGVGPSHLLPVSAHSREALKARAAAYAELLGDAPSVEDACHWAGARRGHLKHRLTVMGDSREQLSAALRSFLAGTPAAAVGHGQVPPGRRPGLVFVFTGQGAQWPGMGRELLEGEAVYRDVFERCCRLLGGLVDWSLEAEVFREAGRSRLAETQVAQPTLFAVQVALAALWRSWGIEPDAVIGHSVGEIAAAHVAGALDLEDALRLAVRRGRVMEHAGARGAMAAVQLSPVEAAEAIRGHERVLAVAAHNGPRSSVLSGDPGALERVLDELRRGGVASRALPVDYAFHSPGIQPLAEDLEQTVGEIDHRAPALPIFSTLTGAKGPDLTAGYWARQLREPVLFAEAVAAAVEDGHERFVEIGPHPALSGGVAQCLAAASVEGLVLPSLRRGEGERATMLASLGRLYAGGARVEWAAVEPGMGRPVRLPRYPWQRGRHWVSPAVPLGNGVNGSVHPLLGRHVRLAAPAGTHLWETELDGRFLPYLGDHRIEGAALLPVAAFVEMALAAGRELWGKSGCALRDLSLDQPLVVPDDATQSVQLVLSTVSEDEAAFQVYSSPPNGGVPSPAWVRHATGRVGRLEAAAAGR